jgi:hypothetical protein
LLLVLGLAIALAKTGGFIILDILLAITGLILTCSVIRKLRAKRGGYYIEKSGGAEDGFITYYEGSKTVRLYFNRVQDVIYVPSETKWKQIMPEWAKERKDEIVGRIKEQVGTRLIGKSWSYEESEKEETMLPQD